MENKDILPKTYELVEKSKLQPTEQDRINALESAITDLAIMLMEVSGDG